MKKSYIVLAAILIVVFSVLVYKGIIEKSNTPSRVPPNTDKQKAYESTKNGFDPMKDEAIGFIKIGVVSGDILKKLGRPEKKSKLEVWGADGEEHQTWYYQAKGIELDLVGSESKQAVNMITISSPCNLKSKRGIGIGSTRDEVLKAYKKEIDLSEVRASLTDSDELVAGTVYDGLIFDIVDDRVSSIFIGAAAE